MTLQRPSFTMGIEEEYMLVDSQTRNLVTDPDPAMFDKCRELLGERVTHELLRSQIEISTKPCSSLSELGHDLRRLRRAVIDTAREYGMLVIASSTHPFAQWWEQQVVSDERYQVLTGDMQAVAHRLVTNGMHVHVGIEDPEMRIDLMGQVTYFMAHLLALSTSSPFWGGKDTGLKSYRLNVFHTLPRTGLPEVFESWSAYQRHVDVLIGAGIIEDATKIWWDIRPSARYPTLEMRVTDVCTKLEDALAIAAVYVCLLSMLFRLRTDNQKWRSYATFLLEENVWRAQRYGSTGSLMDFGQRRLVPFSELVEEMIEMLIPDAEEMGCVDEVQHVRQIVMDGTSAERQLGSFRRALNRGATEQEALVQVVDMLADNTAANLA
ncbi:MAG: carboxylate-amine ligase [bacterium]|nr:carboxylate-amine ligase [Acidimicrobiia bacterium]MCY4650478.1 carboxylate-amine ligase [bacterium]